jgi:hypothetical protein
MSIGDLRIKIRHGDRVETATGRCESRRRPLAVPVGQEADDEADDLRREVAKGAHGGRDESEGSVPMDEARVGRAERQEAVLAAWSKPGWRKWSKAIRQEKI